MIDLSNFPGADEIRDAIAGVRRRLTELRAALRLAEARERAAGGARQQRERNKRRAGDGAAEPGRDEQPNGTDERGEGEQT